MCGTPYLLAIRSPWVPFPEPGGPSMMTRIGQCPPVSREIRVVPDSSRLYQVTVAGPRAGAAPAGAAGRSGGAVLYLPSSLLDIPSLLDIVSTRTLQRRNHDRERG